jgi:hypothetical protein
LLLDTKPKEMLEGVEAARLLLSARMDDGRQTKLAQAIIVAVQSGSEPAELLLRDILAMRVVVPGGRAHLVGAMFNALYYDETGLIREKPFYRPLNALFAVQSEPDLSAVVGHLGGRLAAEFPSKFLVVPDPATPIVGINISSERRTGGGRTLIGLFHGEASLLMDAPVGEERSLNVVYGGALTANVFTFRQGLARHFCAPTDQLRLNLHRSEVLFWDRLSGFVEWGPKTRILLG